MKRKKSSVRFIQKVEDVPEGYVLARGFGVDSVEYKAITNAVAAGRVRAVKLVRNESELRGGCIWVHQEDAEQAIDHALLKRNSAHAIKSLPKQAPSNRDAAPQAVDETPLIVVEAVQALKGIDETLREFFRLLDRIADAAESIATQPAARDHAGSIAESNGFHS